MLFLLFGEFSLFGSEKVPQLLLPGRIYAVPGIEMNVYFSNVFLTINPDNYVFDIDCPKGRNDGKRWSFTPTDEDAGTYAWKITVSDDNEVVASGSAELVVTPKNTGGGRDVSILIIGDSLTDQSFPAKRLLNYARS